MAVSTSSLAGVGGFQTQIQQSNLWSTSEGYRLILLPPVRKKRAEKWSSLSCNLDTNRPSDPDHEPPGCPGNNIYSTGTVLVPGEAPTSNKGWTNAMGIQDQRLANQFKELVVLASDRTEMHTILAKQRDNWNSLFHSTITVVSVSAASAAAMNSNGVEQAVGLSVVASILGLGAAALMALVNKCQPSQLADEQRHAARFFKHLTADIEGTLETDFRLREEASHYWEEKVATLHALDSTFPMPLIPVVLEKFPTVVHPSILSGPPVDLATPYVTTSSSQSRNGWTSAAEIDLKRTSQLLHKSDIPANVNMATYTNRLNKILAITSPSLAASGALCNVVDAMLGMHMSSLGAALMVVALFAHSLSHVLQVGAAYETYRNCAGYCADAARSIEKVLRLPVEQRADGMLFLAKISLQLGRHPGQSPLVQLDEEKACNLF